MQPWDTNRPDFADYEWKGCGDNYYIEEDPKKVMDLVGTEDIVTKSWYAGMKEYNYATGEPRASGVADR